MDRRRFVQTVVGGVAAGAITSQTHRAFAQARTAPDLVFLNGPIVTMNTAQPTAEAVAVKAGRISAVGTRQEIEALCDAQTQKVDLGGKSLSPGIIDAHSHLVGYGQMELYFVKVRPPQVHDFASLRRVLAQAAAKLPPGQWIVARGFNEFDEGRFPRRQEIDGAVPRHPTLIIHWTGQYGIANTLGLQTAGLLTADARDPYGGKYLRDRNGVPDGCLLHYPAIYSVYQPTMTEEQEAQATLWGIQRLSQLGITCVHDNFCHPPQIMRYMQLERGGTLPMRIRAYPYVPNLQACQQLCQQMMPRARRYPGTLVRVQGVKLAVDGYPLMYRVLPQHERVNIPMHPPDQFQAMISTIHNAGWQVDVHAAGDLGVDLTLDAFSKAAGGDKNVVERRHRIEHYMFYSGKTIERTAAMGVPVCTQPAWIPVRSGDLIRKVGWEQVTKMVPTGSFLRAGVALSFGADVPASPTAFPVDSMAGAMVRRTSDGRPLDPSEKLTFMQALWCHTLGAAYAAFDEKELGSIEVGKAADFAVWNADLRTVTEANVGGLKVVATYVGGKAVWGA